MNSKKAGDDQFEPMASTLTDMSYLDASVITEAKNI